MAEPPSEPLALAEALAGGDRRALARAITLVESARHEDGPAAEQLLAAALARGGSSLRLGVSGPPGAGKSTLIDALGLHALERGERVAVLAIDPSSPVGGGSLLGDKTRMARLAVHPQSFVRPSPSRGVHGGLGRRTREALVLCEAAGYSVVIVETLGTGQGEHAVAAIVDCLLLVLLAGAGDEIQGMKRGVLELADVVAVNKADGANRDAAERAATDLTSALGILARASREREPEVRMTSALEGLGVAELWSAIERRVAGARASGRFHARRQAGLVQAFDEELEAGFRARLAAPEVAGERVRLEAAIVAGALSPRAAARELLARLGSSGSETVAAH
ncbi:MAG TPA: methylmalonyl Co-A mutase-associated GTPase MeaB [Polyangiaceae bacterium]|nr:methylmalonyl Co-A mutase-associated GTPase MeaB [Polyangiaceae bacterium]